MPPDCSHQRRHEYKAACRDRLQWEISELLHNRRSDPRLHRGRHKRRNRIEIMFGRLKDWRRVATRYDRCPTVFFSAICLATTVMFWL
ncbi:transposase [Gluconobacter sp. P1C6_b]|uniref:transposase n=1 Tax=Gluconobacter sp. P1C6_b TaxID=2762619 RepID=UPI0035300020